MCSNVTGVYFLFCMCENESWLCIFLALSLFQGTLPIHEFQGFE